MSDAELRQRERDDPDGIDPRLWTLRRRRGQLETEQDWRRYAWSVLQPAGADLDMEIKTRAGWGLGPCRPCGGLQEIETLVPGPEDSAFNTIPVRNQCPACLGTGVDDPLALARLAGWLGDRWSRNRLPCADRCYDPEPGEELIPFLGPELAERTGRPLGDFTLDAIVDPGIGRLRRRHFWPCPHSSSALKFDDWTVGLVRLIQQHLMPASVSVPWPDTAMDAMVLVCRTTARHVWTELHGCAWNDRKPILFPTSKANPRVLLSSDRGLAQHAIEAMDRWAACPGPEALFDWESSAYRCVHLGFIAYFADTDWGEYRVPELLRRSAALVGANLLRQRVEAELLGWLRRWPE